MEPLSVKVMTASTIEFKTTSTVTIKSPISPLSDENLACITAGFLDRSTKSDPGVKDTQGWNVAKEEVAVLTDDPICRWISGLTSQSSHDDVSYETV